MENIPAPRDSLKPVEFHWNSSGYRHIREAGARGRKGKETRVARPPKTLEIHWLQALF